MASKTEEIVVNIEPLLRRRWVCQVVRSGYHNGAGCTPSEHDHHGGWGCAYRFEMSIQDTPENRALLGISDAQAARL